MSRLIIQCHRHFSSSGGRGIVVSRVPRERVKWIGKIMDAVHKEPKFSQACTKLLSRYPTSIRTSREAKSIHQRQNNFMVGSGIEWFILYALNKNIHEQFAVKSLDNQNGYDIVCQGAPVSIKFTSTYNVVLKNFMSRATMPLVEDTLVVMMIDHHSKYPVQWSPEGSGRYESRVVFIPKEFFLANADAVSMRPSHCALSSSFLRKFIAHPMTADYVADLTCVKDPAEKPLSYIETVASDIWNDVT